MSLSKKEKFVTLLCGLILVFSVISILISWATRHALLNGSRFSSETQKNIIAVASLPIKVKDVLKIGAEKLVPPTGVTDQYKNIKVSNKSNLSGYLIIPSINNKGVSKIDVVDLNTKSNKCIYKYKQGEGKLVYSDTVNGSTAWRQSLLSSRFAMYHPHLSKSRVLTFNFLFNDIVSYDLFSRTEVWRIRGAFHHSIELDNHGNYWTCGSVDPVSNLNIEPISGNPAISFEDQAIIKISPSGKVLQSISVMKLLLKNQLEHLMYGVSNLGINRDPFHLNYVYPISQTDGVFKEGDLLVSLRNLSTVLLVNTREEKVVWSKTGPWMNQHSVTPKEKTVISMLDNHSFASAVSPEQYWLDGAWRTRILNYDILSGKVNEIDSRGGQDIILKIPISGRVFETEDKCWIVEDSIGGTIIGYRGSEIVYKWSNSFPDGSVGPITWCRYISKNDFDTNLITPCD
jgi:hypothetical protein